jgi:shikimate dehydrogenase
LEAPNDKSIGRNPETGVWRESVSSDAVARAARRLRNELAARSVGAPGTTSHVVVGLLGRGIQASKTPFMHEREGARVGIPYTYVLIDFDALELEDDDLGAMIEAAEGLGFAGVNVTHPFKQSVITHLRDVSSEAAAIGAVNTVVFSKSQRTGHNTDCWGFAESFREGLPGVALASVVQLGAGGAGAAVAYALMTLGVGRLVLSDTDLGRAERLTERLRERFSRPVEVVRDIRAAVASADGVVNTTPIGMAKYPGMAMPATTLQARHWVAEIIYFPAETELLAVARSLGCRTLAGTGMAVYQAVKAFELFTGIVPDRSAMIAHFRSAA